MSETQLLTQVMRALAIEPGVIAWRSNTRTLRLGGRLTRFGLGNGSADVIGLVSPSGRFLALELKTETGRVSDEQKKWGQAVVKAGGMYAVVRSVAEARRA